MHSHTFSLFPSFLCTWCPTSGTAFHTKKSNMASHKSIRQKRWYAKCVRPFSAASSVARANIVASMVCATICNIRHGAQQVCFIQITRRIAEGQMSKLQSQYLFHGAHSNKICFPLNNSDAFPAPDEPTVCRWHQFAANFDNRPWLAAVTRCIPNHPSGWRIPWPCRHSYGNFCPTSNSNVSLSLTTLVNFRWFHGVSLWTTISRWPAPRWTQWTVTIPRNAASDRCTWSTRTAMKFECPTTTTSIGCSMWSA